MRNRILVLLAASKPLKGLAIAKKLGVHSLSYAREIDPELSLLEFDGLIDTNATGGYRLTARARELAAQYGAHGLRAVDTY